MKKALINLRCAVSRGNAKTCAYSAARFKILAQQLNSEIVPAWEAESLYNFDEIIIAELPVTLMHGGARFRTPAIDIMRNQLEIFSELKDKQFYFFNPQPLDFYLEQINIIEKRFPALKTDLLKSVLLNEDKAAISDKMYSSVVIGDSHSAMMWSKGWDCLDLPGKTLYGWLNEPLDISNYKSIKIMLGNIDLHHHLMNQDDTLELVNRYTNYLKDLLSEVILEVVEPMPALPDTHQLRKCYWYKGKPFGANCQVRNSNRTLFVNKLKEAGFNTITPSICFEAYDKLNYGISDLHARVKHYKGLKLND